MNRAQRRALIKKPEVINQVLDLKDYSHQKELQRQKKLLIQTIVHEYVIVATTVLHDKFGFGKIRIERFLDHVINLWLTVDEEYVTIKDLEDLIKEEVGITI